MGSPTKYGSPLGAQSPSAGTARSGIGQFFFMVIIVIWLSVLTLERTETVGRYVSSSFGSDKDARETRAIPTFDTSKALVQDKYITGGKNVSWRFPPDMPFLEALPTCETLKCVRDAHLQPRGDARFNFPHFIIAGYSKSASTSLYKYLIHHPEVIVPKVKEASLFTDRCSFEGKRMDCPDERVREYIQDFLRAKGFSQKSRGQRAVFEATPRIMDLGPVFAETLYDLMPWVRLISSMREPISRSISKYVMLWDKQIDSCMTNNTLTHCLTRDKTPIMGNPKQSYYSHPLKAWLDNFPKEQIHLVQYEDLVGERQSEELIRLKKYIGVSVDGLPHELDFGDANCRHCRIKPEGWPMREKVYRRLIEKVKPDVLELVRLIDSTTVIRWASHKSHDAIKSRDESLYGGMKSLDIVLDEGGKAPWKSWKWHAWQCVAATFPALGIYLTAQYIESTHKLSQSAEKEEETTHVPASSTTERTLAQLEDRIHALEEQIESLQLHRVAPNTGTTEEDVSKKK